MQGIESNTRQRNTCTGSGKICRICHDDGQVENLIAPCHCSGTMGLLHRSCIEKWLSTVASDRCEICGFRYHTKRRPRPFSEWLVRPAHHRDRRNLLGDMICFLLLTPLAAVSAWLCVSGAKKYAQYSTAKWETVGLITLSTFLIVVYIIWCLVALRYHVRIYIRWRSTHQVVHIMEQVHGAGTDSLSDHSPGFPASRSSSASLAEYPETAGVISNLDGIRMDMYVTSKVTKGFTSTRHFCLMPFPLHTAHSSSSSVNGLSSQITCSSELAHIIPQGSTSTSCLQINPQESWSAAGSQLRPQSSASDTQLFSLMRKGSVMKETIL